MVNKVLVKVDTQCSKDEVGVMYMRLIQSFKSKVTHVLGRSCEYNRMRNDYGATDSSSGLRAL